MTLNHAAWDRIDALRWSSMPDAVKHQAARCLLDLIGVAAAGSRLPVADRIAAFASDALPGESIILFRPERASPIGAALANATQIDGFDAHDGYNPAKGHAGVAIFPALLAATELAATRGQTISGERFLEHLVIGYEVACRLATLHHAHLPDYHASGSWNSIAGAIVAGRLLRQPRAIVREAAGIADYHGPRGRMMRLIDHPSMVKDSSGWGAMVALSSLQMAEHGFLGAPAEFVEYPEYAETWRDLGERWLILDQYFKPWPVCRWAQPAMTAVIALQRDHDLKPADIERITVHTFHESLRLASRHPQNADEAQYALGYPLAAQLVRGRFGTEEMLPAAFSDPGIVSILDRIDIVEDPAFNKPFPQRRFSRVEIRLSDGTQLDSGPTEAPGDPQNPLSDEQLVEQFRINGAFLGEGRLDTLVATVNALATQDNALSNLGPNLIEGNRPA